MSDYKRPQLTTVSSNKIKESVKCARSKVIRLNLTLSEPNKEWCPVFNYDGLVKAQEKKDCDNHNARSKIQNRVKFNSNDGTNKRSPSDDNEAIRIAKQFEEKYGKLNRKKRCQTYTDLGAGYDENDSFIDNSEAFEERLYEEYVEKKHDGFYVNCERFDKIIPSDPSDVEEPPLKIKKANKRRIEFISDGESDTTIEEPAKKSKVSNEDKYIDENTDLTKRKKSSDLDSRKKIITSGKDLDEDKQSNDGCMQTSLQAFEENNEEPIKVTEDHKSVNDVIESVVNAVNFDGVSRDSHVSFTSGTHSGSLPTTETEDSQHSEEKMVMGSLPCQISPPKQLENLSNEIICVINDLKSASKDSVIGRKFFTSNINSLLLRVKELVDEVMPRLQEAYAQRCLKTSQMKLSEKGTPSYPLNENDTKSLPHIPRKTFTWNETLRNCVKSLIRHQVREYKFTQIKNESLEAYINKYLSEKLLPIWPVGWMKTSTLFKQCSEAVLEEAKLLNIPFPSVSKIVKSSADPTVSSETNNRTKKNKNPDKLFCNSSDIKTSINIIEGIKNDNAIGELDNLSDNTSVIKYEVSKVPLKKKKIKVDMVKGQNIHKQGVNRKDSTSEKQNNGENSLPSLDKTEPIIQKDNPTFLQKITIKSGPMSLKHRILQESAKDVENICLKPNNIDKIVNWSNGLDKPDEEHYNGTNRNNSDEVTSRTDIPHSMSPSEAERRLQEETTAATDILSKLITDQNSHSQNVPACGPDDKVQMQLNEVMQDLVVLNQMSADTVDNTIDINVQNDPCPNMNITAKDEPKEIDPVSSFQEEFYAHIKSESSRQHISGHCDPSTFYEDIPNKGNVASHFNSQVISPNNQQVPFQQQRVAAGVIRPRYYERLPQYSDDDALTTAIQFGWPISGSGPSNPH